MIIISNEQVNNKKYKNISYSEFKERAFGDEGFDVDGILIFNANEIEEYIFDILMEEGEEVKFFTLNGSYPDFINCEVIDWSNNDNSQEKKNKKIIKANLDESEEIDSSLFNTINNLLDESTIQEDSSKKEAKIYVFGSSKGGTGKTFTSIMSTYRYAKTHQHQKIALIDFDIIDGQVGISIHKIKPTMRQFYTEYQKGYSDFSTMYNFSVKANNPYPQNVDFYLAPNNAMIIKKDDFWLTILKNCSENYDVVVIDTGIDYINLAPISYAYKIADKVILITTTSIKSVNSITKQIGKLKGETPNPTFRIEDEIGPNLNIVITQVVSSNEMNKTIYGTLSKKANVVATFGVITDSVSQAEFYGSWDVFDKNSAINKAFDDIMK